MKAEKLQWDLGSEGRRLDLRPHGQAPAATVRGVGVLDGDSHSAQPAEWCPGRRLQPHLARVRASSLAAAATGQGALLRVSSRIPGQGLNLQGRGRQAAPCLCEQAAVRKTELSRRYTHACTHTHTEQVTYTCRHTQARKHICAHHTTHGATNAQVCTPAHPCT